MKIPSKANETLRKVLTRRNPNTKLCRDSIDRDEIVFRHLCCDGGGPVEQPTHHVADVADIAETVAWPVLGFHFLPVGAVLRETDLVAF